MRVFSPIILFLTLGFIFNGCRKSDRNNDTDSTYVEDLGNAHCALYEVFLAAHEANLSTPGIRTFLSCATLTPDTLGNPKSLIVDFGSAGCASPSGRTRSGKLIIYQTGYYSVAGSSCTVYFDSFYINGYNYSSNFTVVTTSTGYLLQPTNLKITAPDSSFFYSCSGSYIMTFSNGAATTIADDDEFTVSGSMTFTGRNGNSGLCTVVNTANLLVKASCAEVVSGQLKVEPNGLAERSLDFGSGTCDKSVSATINTESVTLPIGF
jgi:hypothetical protein